MNFLPKELEDIILDYKLQFENFEKCEKYINNIENNKKKHIKLMQKIAEKNTKINNNKWCDELRDMCIHYHNQKEYIKISIRNKYGIYKK